MLWFSATLFLATALRTPGGSISMSLLSTAGSISATNRSWVPTRLIRWSTMPSKWPISTLLKATEISDSLMMTPNHVEGIYYMLHGNTATANQFFSDRFFPNFLRGAFISTRLPNEDSLNCKCLSETGPPPPHQSHFTGNSPFPEGAESSNRLHHCFAAAF